MNNIELLKYEYKHIRQIHRLWNDVIINEESFYWSNEFTLNKIKEILVREDCAVVAEQNGKVLGFYILHKNNPDKGSHIANALYAVDKEQRDKGIGQLLCNHSIVTAAKLNYKGIVFNSVVENNIASNRLWLKNGFEIVGKIPNGYKTKDGYSNIVIYYLEIDESIKIENK